MPSLESAVKWNRTHTATALVSSFFGSFASIMLVTGGCVVPWPKPPVPPDPVVTKPTAKWLICLGDVNRPTVQDRLTQDGPQVRALINEERYDFFDVNGKECKDRGYDKLLESAGGMPIQFALNEDGTVNGKPRKWMTDEKALQSWCSKHLAGCPPPLAPSKPYKVVARGQQLRVIQIDDSGNSYVETGGERRMLTARSEPAKFGALPKFGDSCPVFPVSQYFECNRENIFPFAEWIGDQDGHGACVGFGWAYGLRKSRRLLGMTDVPLSGNFAYAFLNGGKDQGAVISDGIESLKDHGVCPDSMVPAKSIYERQLSESAKQEARRFKLVDAYRCDEASEVFSAIMSGYIVVYGYEVGTNFENFDKYGVAGADRGAGNHCNHSEGMVKLPDGRWVLINANSWTTKWGPFGNGKCYLDPAKSLFNGTDRPDCCVIRSVSRDPQDPNDPPPLKHRQAAEPDDTVAP